MQKHRTGLTSKECSFQSHNILVHMFWFEFKTVSVSVVVLPLERFHGHGGGPLEPWDEQTLGWTVKQSHVNGTSVWTGPVQKTVDPVHDKPWNRTFDFQHQISFLWLFINWHSGKHTHPKIKKIHKDNKTPHATLLWGSGGWYWTLEDHYPACFSGFGALTHLTDDWGPGLLNCRETSRICRNVALEDQGRVLLVQHLAKLFPQTLFNISLFKESPHFAKLPSLWTTKNMKLTG